MKASSIHRSHKSIQSYDEIQPNEVYCLQNPGGVIFLCTRGSVSDSEPPSLEITVICLSAMILRHSPGASPTNMSP